MAAFFKFGSTPDAYDSALTDAALSQGGLTLPNKAYYVRGDERSMHLREQFRDHIARMLVLQGKSGPRAQTDAQAVVDVETQLAQASRRAEELRDPVNNYHLMPIASLQAPSPGLNWSDFMRQIAPLRHFRSKSFVQTRVGLAKGLVSLYQSFNTKPLYDSLGRFHAL